ncbi:MULTISPECIES: hypothetical protein [Rhizobium]|uniref:hypothetical protein n=1 Tax=Rhizobium TaxID=379 RepID=UPI001A8FC5AF|nr:MULTISPECIES: hypothetical protein [Rhizobium]MBN9981860.1 hypothetical protein [Rhizobium laguerreae]MBY5660695.1 hypothetical protein [Rhizobium leguminosarum]MBY5674730.1 hypothetical protein [Rhizobium leguminosarum]
MGTVKIELNASTTEEIKKELEKVMNEVQNLKIDPSKKSFDIGQRSQLWKVSYET